MNVVQKLVFAAMVIGASAAIAEPAENAHAGTTPAIAPLAAPVPGNYTRQIRDDHDRNTAYFSWAPAAMHPLRRLDKTWPEDHYRLCLFIGDSCETAATGQTFEVVPGKRDIPPFRYRPQDHGLKIDLAFQETRFQWSVAACSSETQTCGPYSDPLPVDWTQKRLPVLVYPEHGAVRDPMAKTLFRWDATEDAEFYLLCMAKPEHTCPNKLVGRSDDVFTLVLPNTQRQGYLETLLNSALADQNAPSYARHRLDGQAMYWTVAICRDGACHYQPKVNTITFDRGPAYIHVRNQSQYDINDLWLVGPSDASRTLLTHDMSNFATPGTLKIRGGQYGDDYLAKAPRHHLGIAEPNVAPYYHLEFRRQLAGSVIPVYETGLRKTVSFAPGITYIPGYEVIRETLFIFDQGTAFEQLLRGPDNQDYVYRPGGQFTRHPEAGPGPVRLDVLRAEGYEAY